MVSRKKQVVQFQKIYKNQGRGSKQHDFIVTGNKESEVAKVYKKSQGGYYFSDNSVSSIIECVIALKKDNNLCNQLGKNAERFVEKNYSKENILDNFILELNK